MGGGRGFVWGTIELMTGRVRTLTGKEIELDIEADYKVCVIPVCLGDVVRYGKFSWEKRKRKWVEGDEDARMGMDAWEDAGCYHVIPIIPHDIYILKEREEKENADTT